MSRRRIALTILASIIAVAVVSANYRSVQLSNAHLQILHLPLGYDLSSQSFDDGTWGLYWQTYEGESTLLMGQRFTFPVTPARPASAPHS